MTQDQKANWSAITRELAMVIIAMAGFWLVHARHLPTREETLHMIETQAPYVEDRKLVRVQLQRNETSNRDLARAIGGLQQELSRLRVYLEESPRRQ